MKAKKSVILVEDDPIIRDLLEQAINSLKYFDFVVTAQDGLEAYFKLEKQEFDLIIMDLNLPKKNGIDLVSKVLNQKSSMASRIMILSGEVDQESVSKLVSMGVTNFVVKPLKLEDFLVKVKKTISKSKTCKN